MSRKVIGYIAPDFFPKSKAAAVRSTFFVDELKKKYDVVVFTERICASYSVVSNITSLPANTDSSIKRLLKEILYGSELFVRILFSKQKYCYIISSPPFFITLFAFFASKIKNRSCVILDIRDIYPKVLFEHGAIGGHSVPGRMLSKLEKLLYAGSKKIITVTDGLKKSIEETLDGYGDKVCVVKNGFDEKIFKYVEKKYNKFTLVFHGTLGHFQNIELLIDLIAEMEKTHPKVQFLVVGDGSKASLLQSLKAKNLQYYPQVDYRKIPGLVAGAHIGLSFRSNDKIAQTSIPVKIYEYIGLGIPVVVTPLSEAGKMLEGDGVGKELENDLAQVVKGIEYIRDNYSLFLNNIRKSRYKYSRQYQGRKLLEIIP